MTLYFSRLKLKRDPSVEALKLLVDPPDEARRTDAHHRLLWSVFSDGPERKRDFIWRAEPRGKFFVLSQRPPGSNPLFEIPETKEFTPSLSEGDCLRFMLRANAVRSVTTDQGSKAEQRKRGRKVDVAMHLLREIPGNQGVDSNGRRRASARSEIAQQASLDWLERQGQASGFVLNRDQFVLNDYSTVSLPGHRGKRKGEPRFGVFDMKGEFALTDPAAFISKLACGFGRAKAFGCGLMLIRRA